MDSSLILSVAVTIAVGYLLGSIPFGLLLTKLVGLGDIRNIGSGNIGATNVLRTGRKGLAALTLLLDAIKGIVAIKFIEHGLSSDMVGIAALSAMLGHLFPVWLKFKGGKGVATAAGCLLALSPPVGLSVIGTWVLMAALFRYSSLAAIIAALLTPLYTWIFAEKWLTIAGFISAMVLLRHKDNIKRLLAGTETKIGKK